MKRTGRSTRDPGADRARARLERRHGRSIHKALLKVRNIVIPNRATVRSMTVEGAVKKLHDRKGVIRDALFTMLTDAALLGAGHGWGDVESTLGITTNAILGISWDLVHQDALDWVLGRTVSGISGWGDGYGVENLTAQIVRTSEAQLRTMIGEWVENGEHIDALIDRVEGVTFSRRRANLIAVTEVTRAYALGNIIAWQRSGVITQMAWQNSRDEIVCPICRPLGGVTAPVGQSFRSREGRLVGPPPAHPACRCWLTAVVE